MAEGDTIEQNIKGIGHTSYPQVEESKNEQTFEYNQECVVQRLRGIRSKPGS